MSMIDTPAIRALGRFLDLAVFRESLITSNMANVDTPNFRTVDINFRQELERASDEMQLAATSPLVRRVQGLAERPDGNNVSLEREGLLLSETQLRFSAAVQLLRSEFHRLSSAIHEGSGS